MLKIGITGGIGSGKTIICKIFELLGAPVYYADAAAKRLMQSDDELINAIKKNFGEQAYNAGQLDRKYLAAIIFNNKEKLKLLNSLVHPVTIRDADKWMAVQQFPYAIKEAALIFETEAFHYLDKVIGVYAPKTLRIHRTIQRDHIGREEVINRMKEQIQEEVKMKLCDYIIKNDEQELVIPQIMKLHEEFCSLS